MPVIRARGPRRRFAATKLGSGRLSNKTLQMMEAATAERTTSEVPAGVHEALGFPGQPLDEAIRAHFEPRFGYDISRVRVHTGRAAEQPAQEVNAGVH